MTQKAKNKVEFVSTEINTPANIQIVGGSEFMLHNVLDTRFLEKMNHVFGQKPEVQQIAVLNEFYDIVFQGKLTSKSQLEILLKGPMVSNAIAGTDAVAGKLKDAACRLKDVVIARIENIV